MDFGASMFMTDYCIPAAELGRALEERGFESLWNPEHSHIPLSRKTPFPGGGDLPKMYYDALDPFVTLTAAAAATLRWPRAARSATPMAGSRSPAAATSKIRFRGTRRC